jgi:hypothetical protein
MMVKKILMLGSSIVCSLGICLVALSLTVCFCQTTQAEETITVLKTRLINEAIPAWQELEKNSKHLSFTIVESRDDIKQISNRDHSHSTCELSMKGDNILSKILYDNEDGTVMQNISCKNAKYLFEIDRLNQNTPWTLNNLLVKQNGIGDYDKYTMPKHEIISTPWAILGTSMADIVNNPTFEMKSVTIEKKK